MTFRDTRRRLLIAAAASPLLSLPGLLRPDALASPSSVEAYRWRGVVLGGAAQMVLGVENPKVAEQFVRHATAEIDRLENIFSLYREDSVLCQLNREGRVDNPPPELLAVLGLSRDLWRQSGGAFDPSILPVWQAHAAGASGEDLQQALARVDFGRVIFSPDGIRFKAPGMGLTFNGIAQGFITDRVVALLKDYGLTHSLVELGETRTLGPRRDGAPWRVGIEDPARPGQALREVTLDDNALAVSRGSASPCPGRPGLNHLLDPQTGQSPAYVAEVAVRAPTALLADGLSTAASLLPDAKARALLDRYTGVTGYFVAAGA